MTSADVVNVLARRWYVVVAGLALVAAAIVAISTRPGVYSTQADVLFLAPKSAKNPNPIEAGSESLIATAGMVARIVAEGKDNPATASSGVTLTGEGVRQGVSIRLPNSGGQWANNFDRPALDIQVAGPSEAWVRTTLNRQIGRIDRTLYELQKDDGIPAESFITTSSSPHLAQVVYSNGRPTRAMAAILVLGLTLTAFAAVGFDRAVAAARRRRASVPPGELVPPLSAR